MSLFNDILEIKKHDGRPLWQYKLSEEQYQILKGKLSVSPKEEIDPREVTLYFAEWWKNEYESGIPSKLAIYESLGSNCTFDDEENFFEFAREGASLLDISIVQGPSGYNLYFRTILSQGGLPIKNLLANIGPYTNFLKKVLELRPSSVEEIQSNTDILNLLPQNSRNESIYASCLEIVNAIWNDDYEYLASLEATQIASFKVFAKELRDHKTKIRENLGKTIKFKWVMEIVKGITKITFELNSSNIINIREIARYMKTDISQRERSYNIFVNNHFICKLEQMNKNPDIYTVDRLSPLRWDYDENIPLVEITDNNGNSGIIPNEQITPLVLSEPSLWVQKGDNRWEYQKGKHCNSDKANLLFDSSWKLNEDSITEEISINRSKYSWTTFEREIEIISEQNEKKLFSTVATAFNWEIGGVLPHWILSSNLVITNGLLPRINLYDNEEKSIHTFEKYWRAYGEKEWNDWTVSTLPIGCIEINLIVNGVSETDKIYNIGNLGVEILSNEATKASIKYSSLHEDLKFEVKANKANPQLDMVHEGETIKISLNNIQKVPKSIEVEIRKNQQRCGLHIILQPLFKIVELIDPNQNVLGNGSVLIADQLYGYRIFNYCDDSTEIRIYNSSERFERIRFAEVLKKKVIDLNLYNENIVRMLRLTDPIDRNTSVTIEIRNKDRETIYKSCIVKNHNHQLDYNYVNNQLEYLRLDQKEINLVAVPVDKNCSPENIREIALLNDEGIHTFPKNLFMFLQDYVVMASADTAGENKLLPKFVKIQRDPSYKHPTDPVEIRQLRIIRTQEYIQELENAKLTDDSWQKVKIYFDISLKYKLPFTTFDYIRATSYKPELAAKLICLLFHLDGTGNFDKDIIRIRVQLEEELGIGFHWIAGKHWLNAINWMIASDPDEDSTDMFFWISPKIMNFLQYNDTVSTNGKEKVEAIKNNFEKISRYILGVSEQSPTLNNFLLNPEIQEMRGTLSGRVSEELPELCPSVSDTYKRILPINGENFRVKLLLKAPLAVALSITGKDESIWQNNEMSDDREIIRRNIQYAQSIHPDWHTKAIIYSINSINRIGK